MQEKGFIFFGGVANRPSTETIEQNYANGFLKDFKKIQNFMDSYI